MGRTTTPEAEAQLDIKHPVLDHGFVSLVDYMGGDQRIAEAAWVSSIDEVDAEKKTTFAIKKIINYMMENRHSSPFEQVELCFRCKLPIFVARQWIRHRTAQVNEMSGRYRILPPESYLPERARMGGKGEINKQGTEGELSDSAKKAIQFSMVEHQKAAWDEYGVYNAEGLASELARLNLPLAAYTEWYWKIDLHNFLHFAGLRRDGHAQWEIRQYADKMYELVRMVAPMACSAWEEFRFHAVTFSRTEMKAIRTVFSGSLEYAIEQARLEGGFDDKALKKFLAKVGSDT